LKRREMGTHTQGEGKKAAGKHIYQFRRQKHLKKRKRKRYWGKGGRTTGMVATHNRKEREGGNANGYHWGNRSTKKDEKNGGVVLDRQKRGEKAGVLWT